MNQQNKRLLKRIQYAASVQFAVNILFWLGVGLDVLKGMSVYAYIFMLLMLLCNVFILLSTYLLNRFYMVYLQDSFDNLEKLNMKMRTQRHEYLNEMQIVYGLLELEEYKEAYAYLKPVYQDIERVGKVLVTSKPAVNALLQAKTDDAASKDITFLVKVTSNLSGIAIPQWDLCKILGNLIDNAITAVSGEQEEISHKEKKIYVDICEDAKNYYFIVSNNGPVIPKSEQKLIFKKGYSSKKEAGHGLGLGIISDIVKECNGNIQLTSNDTKTEFEVKIPKMTV